MASLSRARTPPPSLVVAPPADDGSSGGGAYCRVCFEGAEAGCSPLVAPCRCSDPIHRHCLRRWQRSALASENPKRARVCNVCGVPYCPPFCLGRGKAARLAKAAQSQPQQQGSNEELGGGDDDDGDGDEIEEELGDDGGPLVKFLHEAANTLESLLSPGFLLKSVTLFGLALLVPYLVLSYYVVLSLTFIDPFDRGGSEARAEAVAPGRSFLVAASSIPRASVFHRSIVLVLEHGAWGSRGVIVNKSLVLCSGSLRAAAATTAAGRALFGGGGGGGSPGVLLGGPVDPHVLTLVHNDEEAAAARELAPGLFVETVEGEGSSAGGGSIPHLLRRWRRDGPPRGARAFSGYAGWAQQQLCGEIRRGDWCVCVCACACVIGFNDGVPRRRSFSLIFPSYMQARVPGRPRGCGRAAVRA